MKNAEVNVKYLNDLVSQSNDLTKLELISAMCLQGLLSSTDTFNTEQRVKYAIDCAKELLKQLEADHE